MNILKMKCIKCVQLENMHLCKERGVIKCVIIWTIVKGAIKNREKFT